MLTSSPDLPSVKRAEPRLLLLPQSAQFHEHYIYLQVPWTALGRQQVQVEIDRLYVLAVPSYLQEAPPPEDADAEEERLAAKKRADVGSAEQQWVSHMQSMDESGSVASQPGYLQGVANVVLGNLKIKVLRALNMREQHACATGSRRPGTCMKSRPR